MNTVPGAGMAGGGPLLEVRELTVRFPTRRGPLTAVAGIDLDVAADEVLAVVGESGSGKSVAMLAVMGLLPGHAEVSARTLRFDGHDLRAMPAAARRALLGRTLAMIFQEPTASLNPCFTVGFQIAEVLRSHLGLGRRAARARAIELLAEVGIGDPQRRATAFPHQMSGGMNQRVMIAMAIACRPRLLIADEPTTALDVTIQAQILDLLRHLRRQYGMGLVLITHDLGVVAEMADRVVVQYAGRQVESQATAALFAQPRHPYTAGLLAALPERAQGRRLPAIPGQVADLYQPAAGCVYAPRCPLAAGPCWDRPPSRAAASLGRALCHTPLRGDEPAFRPAGQAQRPDDGGAP